MMAILPLLIATREGHALVVEWLLQRGADLEATQATGETALMFAAESDSVDTAAVGWESIPDQADRTVRHLRMGAQLDQGSAIEGARRHDNAASHAEGIR